MRANESCGCLVLIHFGKPEPLINLFEKCRPPRWPSSRTYSLSLIAFLFRKPKSELSQAELRELEAHDIKNGPMAMLTSAVQQRLLILISTRSNRKILARCLAYDRHFNMVLEQAREMWTERPRRGKGVKRAQRSISRERFIGKMFLRGDSVIGVVFTSTPAALSS